MKYYEVSSAGDKRYSALYAKVKYKDIVNTIEWHYQCQIKGYESIKQGKGKKGKLYDYQEQKELYLLLWMLYFKENPNLLYYIVGIINAGYTLHDKFATSSCNQAWAIDKIAREFVDNKKITGRKEVKPMKNKFKPPKNKKELRSLLLSKNNPMVKWFDLNKIVTDYWDLYTTRKTRYVVLYMHKELRKIVVKRNMIDIYHNLYKIGRQNLPYKIFYYSLKEKKFMRVSNPIIELLPGQECVLTKYPFLFKDSGLTIINYGKPLSKKQVRFMPEGVYEIQHEDRDKLNNLDFSFIRRIVMVKEDDYFAYFKLRKIKLIYKAVSVRNNRTVVEGFEEKPKAEKESNYTYKETLEDYKEILDDLAGWLVTLDTPYDALFELKDNNTIIIHKQVIKENPSEVWGTSKLNYVVNELKEYFETVTVKE